MPKSFQPALDVAPLRLSRSRSLSIPPPLLNESDLEMQNNPMKPSAGSDVHLSSNKVFHAEFYLTSLKKAEDVIRANLTSPNTHFFTGRPDIKAIFQRTQSLCVDEKISRVAVAVCGPDTMINDVADCCELLSSKSLQFHCHKENFNF